MYETYKNKQILIKCFLVVMIFGIQSSYQDATTRLVCKETRNLSEMYFKVPCVYGFKSIHVNCIK